MFALIQKPGRKRHLAVLRPDGTCWDTLGSCRLEVPTTGTSWESVETTAGVTRTDPTVCIPCLHLIAFAHFLAHNPEHLTGVPAGLHAVAS